MAAGHPARRSSVEEVAAMPNRTPWEQTYCTACNAPLPPKRANQEFCARCEGQANLCLSCGKHPAVEGSSLCPACAERIAATRLAHGATAPQESAGWTLGQRIMIAGLWLTGGGIASAIAFGALMHVPEDVVVAGCVSSIGWLGLAKLACFILGPRADEE